jgi:hypothetical protein
MAAEIKKERRKRGSVRGGKEEEMEKEEVQKGTPGTKGTN